VKIFFRKRFQKNFDRLPEKIQHKTRETLALFVLDPTDSTLKNHALSGRLIGQRAISVTGDYRIIFEQKDDYFLVIIIDVGRHATIYGK
jgi:addiction module RelE/StbE family toxin